MKNWLSFFQNLWKIIKNLLNFSEKSIKKVKKKLNKSIKIHIFWKDLWKSLEFFEKINKKNMRIHENPWEFMKFNEMYMKIGKIFENHRKSIQDSWRSMKTHDELIKIR